MIVYSHEDPLCQRLLGRSGSVLPEASRWACLSGTLAIAISIGLNEAGVQEMVVERLDGLGMAWAGFTAFLGMMVSFRNNQAYARFWEGASLVSQMRGEWLNATSSLLAFCSVQEEVSQEVANFQQLLVRLISLLHCSALQNICEINEDNLEIIDVGGIEEASLLHLEDAHDRCEVIVHWLQRLIIKAQRERIVTADPPILSRCFQEISRGFVNLHNVRKIRDIPQPFPYTQVLLWTVVLHTLLTPAFAGCLISVPYVAGLLCFFVTCMLWSIVYIADQIDQPFGEDPNDLPSVEMQSDFNDSLLGLMHPAVLRVPYFVPTGEGIALKSFSERRSISSSDQEGNSQQAEEEAFAAKPSGRRDSRHSADAPVSASMRTTMNTRASRASGVFVLPSSGHSSSKGNRFARQATKSMRHAAAGKSTGAGAADPSGEGMSRGQSDNACSVKSGGSGGSHLSNHVMRRLGSGAGFAQGSLGEKREVSGGLPSSRDVSPGFVQQSVGFADIVEEIVEVRADVKDQVAAESTGQLADESTRDSGLRESESTRDNGLRESTSENGLRESTRENGLRESTRENGLRESTRENGVSPELMDQQNTGVSPELIDKQHTGSEPSIEGSSNYSEWPPPEHDLIRARV